MPAPLELGTPPELDPPAPLDAAEEDAPEAPPVEAPAVLLALVVPVGPVVAALAELEMLGETEEFGTVSGGMAAALPAVDALLPQAASPRLRSRPMASSASGRRLGNNS